MKTWLEGYSVSRKHRKSEITSQLPGAKKLMVNLLSHQGIRWPETVRRKPATEMRRRMRSSGKRSGIWTSKRKFNIHMKACHNSIPVGVNLQKRGIEVDEKCRQCGTEAETTEHLFFQCYKAKLIWKLSTVSWEGPLAQTRSFKEWWKAESQARQEVTAYILWHI